MIDDRYNRHNKICNKEVLTAANYDRYDDNQGSSRQYDVPRGGGSGANSCDR